MIVQRGLPDTDLGRVVSQDTLHLIVCGAVERQAHEALKYADVYMRWIEYSKERSKGLASQHTDTTSSSTGNALDAQLRLDGARAFPRTLTIENKSGRCASHFHPKDAEVDGSGKQVAYVVASSRPSGM